MKVVSKFLTADVEITGLAVRGRRLIVHGLVKGFLPMTVEVGPEDVRGTAKVALDPIRARVAPRLPAPVRRFLERALPPLSPADGSAESATSPSIASPSIASPSIASPSIASPSIASRESHAARPEPSPGAHERAKDWPKVGGAKSNGKWWNRAEEAPPLPRSEASGDSPAPVVPGAASRLAGSAGAEPSAPRPEPGGTKWWANAVARPRSRGDQR